MAAAHHTSGGFLLSPPASSRASSTAGSRFALPRPRERPLRSGGAKESAFIRHVDQHISQIQRRFAKRTSPSSNLLSDVDRDKADSWHDVKGYSSMSEACRDIGGLVKVIWISGTPRLQTPYLMSLALLLTSIISGMPPTPKSLFRVLNKLDMAFASLAQGRDVDTGEVLPGFNGVRGISDTEKVRVRSLVERTRVGVVEAFKRGEFEYEEEPAGDSDDEMVDATHDDDDDDDELIVENEDEVSIQDDELDSLDMQIAKVYDRTMVELGSSLEEPSIGILTERRF